MTGAAAPAAAAVLQDRPLSPGGARAIAPWSQEAPFHLDDLPGGDAGARLPARDAGGHGPYPVPAGPGSRVSRPPLPSGGCRAG
jgi:hypothetical protein